MYNIFILYIRTVSTILVGNILDFNIVRVYNFIVKYFSDCVTNFYTQPSMQIYTQTRRSAEDMEEKRHLVGEKDM